MSAALEAVLRRRAELLERTRVQRERIADSWHALEPPARVIDRAFALAAYLRARPVLTFAILATVAVLRGRRGLARGAGRAVVLWRVGRSALASLRQFLRR